MLPKLALIFGITTDELLGMPVQQKVYEAEVVPDTATDDHPGEDGKHGMEAELKLEWDGGRKSGIALALWVLLVGGLLLASKILDWDTSLWKIVWPSAFLIFGLFGMFPSHFSFFNLGCILFGGYFLLDNLNLLSFQLGGQLVLPIAIILFGLSLLADSLRKKKKPHVHIIHNGSRHKHTSTCEQEGEHFTCSTYFGQEHRYIDLPRLSHGHGEVSFGELTVDLSGCGEIVSGCHVELNCSFGELRLLVPRHCRVEPNIETAFASVNVRGVPAPDAAITICADCDASFGEISIQYI